MRRRRFMGINRGLRWSMGGPGSFQECPGLAFKAIKAEAGDSGGAAPWVRKGRSFFGRSRQANSGQPHRTGKSELDLSRIISVVNFNSLRPGYRKRRDRSPASRLVIWLVVELKTGLRRAGGVGSGRKSYWPD